MKQGSPPLVIKAISSQLGIAAALLFMARFNSGSKKAHLQAQAQKFINHALQLMVSNLGVVEKAIAEGEAVLSLQRI